MSPRRDMADGALPASDAVADRVEDAEPPVPGHAASAPRLSPADLHDELQRFKAELRAAGLRESTVFSYLNGSTLFVRWLSGDYAPGPGR